MDVIRFVESVIVRIIGFFVWFFNSPAVYVLLVLVILYVLNKIYWAIRAVMLKKLVYTRTFSDTGVFAGEEVEMTETIRNEGWFPMLWVDVEAYFFGALRLIGYEDVQHGDMQHFISRFHLMPYTQICRRHSILCSERGYYQLTTAAVTGKYIRFYFDSPAELYVYPKPSPPPVRELAAGWIQGELLSRRRIFREPFSFAGIRDYRFGDPMSLINFKASARIPPGMGKTASLKVNDREFGSTRRVMILLNVHQPLEMEMSDRAYQQLIEQGLSYTAAIVSKGIFSGFAVGFATNSRSVDGSYSLRLVCESGEAHLLEILKAMALIRPRGGISFSSLIEKEIQGGGHFTEYLVFGPELDEKSQSLLETLERLGNSVAIIPLRKEEEET